MGKKKADVVMSVNVNLSSDGGEAERDQVQRWLNAAVASFRVKDWELFGDSED